MTAEARIQQEIDAIKAMFEPKTSEPWDPKRKDRLETMRTGILLKGGEIRPEI